MVGVLLWAWRAPTPRVVAFFSARTPRCVHVKALRFRALHFRPHCVHFKALRFRALHFVADAHGTLCHPTSPVATQSRPGQDYPVLSRPGQARPGPAWALLWPDHEVATELPPRWTTCQSSRHPPNQQLRYSRPAHMPQPTRSCAIDDLQLRRQCSSRCCRKDVPTATPQPPNCA
eukprot:345214-Chlamydomonas_euryale.AAC.2